jgi:hypothetical protein
VAGAQCIPACRRAGLLHALLAGADPDIAVAVIGAVLGEDAAQGQIVAQLHDAIGATTVFVQLRYSLNVIWGVRPAPGRSRFTPLRQFAKTRLLALLVVLLIGLGLLLYFVAVTAIALLVDSFHVKGCCWGLLPALRLFVAPENHDYRLRQPWPGIAAAGDARLFRDLPATPGPRHGRRR